jgi:hypothetical protein
MSDSTPEKPGSMRRGRNLPRSARIKTAGYLISTCSVVLLAVVSWKSAASNPALAACLLGGALSSVTGMGLRWWSYEIEEIEKK